MSLPPDAPLDGHLFGEGQPCFGCGPTHPIGFHLRFERDGDDVVTRFTPGDRYQGPPGILHGGLVATLADELAAWTLIARLGRFGFTTRMDLRLHGPVRIGVEIEGRGRLVRETRRLVDVAVEVGQGGARLASGELQFALLGEAQAERLLGGPLPEAWRRFARAG